MPLDADAIELHARRFQLLDQPQALGALVRLLDVVVVVVQLDARAGRAGELERLHDIIIADRLARWRVAEVLVALVGNRLVDDIPADDLALEMLDDALNVRL